MRVVCLLLQQNLEKKRPPFVCAQENIKQAGCLFWQIQITSRYMHKIDGCHMKCKKLAGPLLKDKSQLNFTDL